jgi:lysine 2,3-aminomutase
MSSWFPEKIYTKQQLVSENEELFKKLRSAKQMEQARQILIETVVSAEFGNRPENEKLSLGQEARVRNCARVLTNFLKLEAENEDFSVLQALWDISRNRPRPDLLAGFFAEMMHIFRGLEGRSAKFSKPSILDNKSSGRKAARERSDELDQIWQAVESAMSRYRHGLLDDVIALRARRREQVLSALGGQSEDWEDWRWHLTNVLDSADKVAKVVNLSDQEHKLIAQTNSCEIPFGVTPYYASLMDENASADDRAIRAQVFPSEQYIDQMGENRKDRRNRFDFMREHDTSPIDTITRRYPAILILKPYNTCPQICVYCQRNWEIDEVLAPSALTPFDKIDEAIDWIKDHPAIREVLVTGGDPLTLADDELKRIFDRLAAIDTIDLIRVGSRTLVTLPMRMTQELAVLLGNYRIPGRREVCVMTHVEHPYEITPQVVTAVNLLKTQGISVFNQQVYTFFVSRRFETARLRMLLRRIGIDPYYTFATKGKEETSQYRVPLARLMQEQKEEARLLPGLRRTDEVVYNVPRLGKSYVRDIQFRELISIAPDGSRVYQFYPWEQNIVERKGYLGEDVPVLDYLSRLAEIGENPEDYESIWYYY